SASQSRNSRSARPRRAPFPRRCGGVAAPRAEDLGCRAPAARRACQRASLRARIAKRVLFLSPSFPRKRESRFSAHRLLWVPAFAGTTVLFLSVRSLGKRLLQPRRRRRRLSPRRALLRARPPSSRRGRRGGR